MKRRNYFIATGIVIALVIVIFTTTTFKAQNNQHAARSDDKQMPVATKQLPPDNGLTAVELKCGNAELPAPNTIQKVRCGIKNNTNKFISAVTVVVSMDIEKEGITSSDASFLTAETLVHPDMRRNNLIPPGGEKLVRDFPTSYEEDVVIRGVTAWIDYVEFEDNTTLGLNKAGSRIVTDIRAGAAKYKDWLGKKFTQRGASINAINSLLETPLAPEEMGIQNGDQEQGAMIYRNYARKTYSAEGAEGLVKRLKLASTSVNK